MLHDLAADSSADVFPLPVLERLATLVDAPNTGYCDLSPSSDDGYYIRTLPEPEWFGEALGRWGHQDPLPCARFAQQQRPMAVSDVMARRAFGRLGLYQHTLRPFGFAETVRMHLPTGDDGSFRFFFFDRERWGLRARERQLLELLRPHFALRRQTWRPVPPGIRSLTEREREILAAVAKGCTNAQIAQELWISHHTVRTHLEHIFEKLNVKTRTQAAARLTPPV